MQIKVFPKFHCMLPMLQQLHKTEHYRPVTVSTVIILTANMLERKMRRLWREMEAQKDKNVQLKNKSTNQRFIRNRKICTYRQFIICQRYFSCFVYYYFNNFLTYLKQHTVLRVATAYSVYRKQ